MWTDVYTIPTQTLVNKNVEMAGVRSLTPHPMSLQMVILVKDHLTGVNMTDNPWAWMCAHLVSVYGSGVCLSPIREEVETTGWTRNLKPAATHSAGVWSGTLEPLSVLSTGDNRRTHTTNTHCRLLKVSNVTLGV